MGGHPKSGTSLLLSLLDGHPEIVAFPEETKYFRHIHGNARCLDAEFLLNERSCARLCRDPDAAAASRRDYTQVDRQTFTEELRALLATTQDRRDVLPALVLAYAKATGSGPRRFWAEKTPQNEFHLDTALRLWPGLRAIYVVRDPRDTFASFRLKRRTRRRQLSVGTFVRRWRRSLAAWDRFSGARPDAACLVRYEDLVSSPETALRRLTTFLDIAWHKALLEPTYCGGTAWGGNSMHGRRFDAISTSPVGGFRSALSEEELHAIERRLACAFARFGWQRCTPAADPRGSLVGRSFDWLIGDARP